MLKHKNKFIVANAFSESQTAVADPKLKFQARALAPAPDI